MHARKSILFSVSMAILLAGCPNANQGTENRFYFYDEESQKVLLQQLKEKGIPYRVDGDGAVWYHAKDSARIEEAKKEVLMTHFANPYSVHYTRDEERLLFVEMLEKQGVAYQIKTRSFPNRQEIWVTWNEKDDERVRKIQKTVRQKMQRITSSDTSRN